VTFFQHRLRLSVQDGQHLGKAAQSSGPIRLVDPNQSR